MTVIGLDDAQYRARIAALPPDDLATLADIMRRRLDSIPVEFAKLREEERQLTEWLAEFAPDKAR